MQHESEEYKALKELLTEDRPVSFRPVLKRITGNYCAALMLAQLLYWTPRSSGDWIYKTDAELGEEICASRGELGTARAVLSTHGLVETKRMGQPARMHYRVNLEAVIAKIAPSSKPEEVPTGEQPEEPENKAAATSCRDSQLQGIPATSCRHQSQTSCRDSLQLSITESTSEMTTSDGADAQAHPSGNETQTNRRDGMDTELAFERMRAAGRAAGRDNAPAAHRLAGRWPHLVGHCVAFEQASGLAIRDVPQSKVGLWVKALEGHVGAGLRPEDERTLVGLARSRKFSVYSPGSLDNLIAVMRQGAAATEQPRYKTLVS